MWIRCFVAVLSASFPVFRMKRNLLRVLVSHTSFVFNVNRSYYFVLRAMQLFFPVSVSSSFFFFFVLRARVFVLFCFREIFNELLKWESFLFRSSAEN